MEKCENCGVKFDPTDAADEFEMNTLLEYNNLKVCLCADCAIEAIENSEEGIYFETCEQCGKEFDLFEDEGEFSTHFSWANGLILRDYWDDQILCAECALDLVESDDDIE